MITLIPHHIPRMIGFSSANRVDMDEFAQGARLIGTQKSLTALSDSVTPKRLTSAGGYKDAQSGQKMIGSDAKGRNDQSATRQNQGVDTTVHATMDMGGGMREPEDE